MAGRPISAGVKRFLRSGRSGTGAGGRAGAESLFSKLIPKVAKQIWLWHFKGMKSILAIVMLLSFLTVARAQQDADESYLAVYGLIQQADTLAGSGQTQAAIDDYLQAQANLTALHNGYPDWNPRIIIFRQKYLSDRITALKSQLPGGPAPVVGAAPVTPGTAPADWADQLAALRTQLQNSQSDNSTLAAKLKEALAAQPATMDPAQLAAAQTQVRDLLKQNELLKASIEAGQKNLAAQPSRKDLDKITRELEKANDKLTAQQQRADKLAAENEANLKKFLASDKALAALRDEAALLRSQLADATNAVPKLQAKLADAQAANAALTKDLQARTAEVATLQKQITAADKASRPVEKLKRELAAAQAAAAAATTAQQGLQDRIRELQSTPTLPAVAGDTAGRIQDLTRERDDLLAQLGEANRKLISHKVTKDESAVVIAQLTADLNSTRAQLAAVSLSPSPYTPEELALFVAPAAIHPAVAKDLPGGSATLAAEAQKHFAARELDLADADYQKILQQDTNNVVTLGNLAAIEIEEGQLDLAETHLRTALAESPADVYIMTQLGNALMHEGKYDDALTTLSRAVQLNPHPDSLNYLGVTLSHKGLRPQAEAALRRAVQMDPGFNPAQMNLANVYADGQPPAPLLARWHYQKALAAGAAHNPGLEKTLAALGAPVAP